ncbi:hypothetical protein [Streptacidiphilus cavernicola]|uniref:Uncharacterized protein n=1 Tax=Streptacidiphilus cavernicola TaxID=3342716 RepID=A0ABV6W687_9ACTN
MTLHYWYHRTWQRDDNRLQVIDPATGTALAESARTGFRALPGPQGRLWAAGDPRSLCVITPAGDGEEQLVLSPVPPTPYRGGAWDPKAERRDWGQDKADAEQVRTEVNHALADALKPSHWRG